MIGLLESLWLLVWIRSRSYLIRVDKLASGRIISLDCSILRLIGLILLERAVVQGLHLIFHALVKSNSLSLTLLDHLNLARFCLLLSRHRLVPIFFDIFTQGQNVIEPLLAPPGQLDVSLVRPRLHLLPLGLPLVNEAEAECEERNDHNCYEAGDYSFDKFIKFTLALEPIKVALI